MGILVLLICALLLMVSIKNNRGKIISPQTLFYMLWTFVLFLSSLGLYNIISPSKFALFLLLLMIIMFFVGSNIPKWNKKKTKKRSDKFNNITSILKNILNKIRERYKPQYKYIIIYSICALIIIFTLIDCIIVFKGLSDGIPMYKIRHWRMGAYGIDNNPMLSRRTFAEEIFRSVILTPFETLLPPIAAYSLFNKKENKKHRIAIIVLSILIIIMSSIAGGGGRLSYIYFFGCVLLAFIQHIRTNKKINLRKYYKYIGYVLLFGLIATIILTKIRTSSSLFKQIYTYFAMPPSLLSLWLDKLENVKHTYGLLTTFGFHSYIFRGFDAIGFDFLVPNLYTQAFSHLLNAEKFMQLGFGVGNAFVTPIYYFYIDGGIPFVCSASLILGITTKYIYEYTTTKVNMKKFILYALLMYGIFLTFIRIQTAIPAYIISFIFTIIVFDEKK